MTSLFSQLSIITDHFINLIFHGKNELLKFICSDFIPGFQDGTFELLFVVKLPPIRTNLSDQHSPKILNRIDIWDLAD